MLKQPIKLLPNIRHEDKDATTGYIWGKPAGISNILKTLGVLKDGKLDKAALEKLDIKKTDTVSEQWIVSDDRHNPSIAMVDGDKKTLFLIIEADPEGTLGPQHVKEFGPYLKTIMKYIDTHPEPTKGSLSVQVHPANNHPGRPAKPEMWRGIGQLYIGWNRDVTEAMIKEYADNNKLEDLMNQMQITKDDLIIVGGGVIHAIRYNTFTAEWSKAPGEDDIKKGNIKDATVSPYDRSDGKTPRPGKEDTAGTFDIMRHAGTFGKTHIADIQSKTIELFNDGKGNLITSLFRTLNVYVDQVVVKSKIELSTEKRGFPMYVEKGAVEIWISGLFVESAKAGDELFIPYSLGKVTFKTTEEALLYKWYVPFKEELVHFSHKR